VVGFGERGNETDNLTIEFMRIFFFVIIFSILFSCSGNKRIPEQIDSSLYRIKKIENKKNWYIIFANRNDSTFMIVSKKNALVSPYWEKIKIGSSYKLSLKSIFPVINGVKMMPMNYLDYEGISIDENTIVNIDPQKGIYDIYSTNDLSGLFFVK
jgi:hypothetical protein